MISIIQRTAIAVIFAGLAGYASAHGGATGVVKERMDAMSALSDALKVVAPMANGGVEIDPEALDAAAGQIVEHARAVPDLFSEEKIGDVSEALPLIWVEWKDFTDHAGQMVEAAEYLREVARSGGDRGAVKVAFDGLAATCKRCHQIYRQKKR